MKNLNFLNFLVILLLSCSQVAAQEDLVDSTLFDPSISYQNWQGSSSNRNGLSARLRSLLKLNSFGLGLDAEYGSFKEEFDNELLGSVNWKQLIFGISAHYFISGHNFSIAYSPYNKISTDSINQYISSQSIATFNDYALKGSSLEFQWSFPLTTLIAGHIRFMRSTYDEQVIGEQTLAYDQTNINTLFLGFSLPFRLGL